MAASFHTASAHLGRVWPVEILQGEVEGFAPVRWQGGMYGRDGPEVLDVFLPDRRHVRRIERRDLFADLYLEILAQRLPQPVRDNTVRSYDIEQSFGFAGAANGRFSATPQRLDPAR